MTQAFHRALFQHANAIGGVHLDAAAARDDARARAPSVDAVDALFVLRAAS